MRSCFAGAERSRPAVRGKTKGRLKHARLPRPAPRTARAGSRVPPSPDPHPARARRAPHPTRGRPTRRRTAPSRARRRGCGWPTVSSRCVDVDPIADLAEPSPQRLGRVAVLLADGHDSHLHGGEPERERAAVVLDQDADESLERAEERPVDDEDGMLAVVGAHVGEPEPSRHLRIELDRPHLPRAPEHVGHVEVDLRAVERALALADEVLDPVPVEGLDQLSLGEVPLGVVCRACCRAGSRAQRAARCRTAT